MSELVDRLIINGDLKAPELIEAFLKNDRYNFVPKNYSWKTYENNPISIGFGQTISQPSTVAFMMELLQPKPGNNVLDIGFGSCWTTAILADVAGEKGSVLSVEIQPEVYKFGIENLKQFNYQNIEFFVGSWEDLSPGKFDRILVSAAADSSVLPKLVSKLKVGGRMVIPVQVGFDQAIQLIIKNNKYDFFQKRYPGFIFVPLV